MMGSTLCKKTPQKESGFSGTNLQGLLTKKKKKERNMHSIPFRMSAFLHLYIFLLKFKDLCFLIDLSHFFYFNISCMTKGVLCCARTTPQTAFAVMERQTLLASYKYDE
jgi:hypothetical protein